MSALTFHLKHVPEQRLDMSPLVCQNLRGRTADEIRSMTLDCGGSRVPVGELFDLSGSDCEDIVIEKACDRMDCVGRGLDGGRITVHGDVGAYAGMQMRRGEIVVRGSAGVLAGCEMGGGTLRIRGDCGDYLGGARSGNRRGMRGGTILVRGSVGVRAGDQMRRGKILIEGDAGDYLGSRMIAGTIAVMGRTGRHVGYAMARGTILLWRKTTIGANFANCGSHTATFLALLFASLRGYESRLADPDHEFHRVQRYAGDLARGGLGEILIRLQ
ncbi:MAG: formylmethanofuran dehydrogenase subunit C [Gammaproteobacteria bacterium]|nr:MAG: formylmethanofuran dehydrogenase subunit C [Gammaproteobacteria bacterium]